MNLPELLQWLGGTGLMVLGALVMRDSAVTMLGLGYMLCSELEAIRRGINDRSSH